MPSLESKILGSLASALIGDAMGSATENLSQEAIRENFGGRVETFCPPPPGTFAEGRKAGELTDDSTQLLEMVEAYIEGDGEIDIHRVAEHLMIWGAKEELAGRFSGPTTRNALKRLREGESPAITGIPPNTFSGAGASNGAAMKVAPAGLFNPGNLEKALQDAITLCIPTHNTNLAYSGAAAVSCAIAEALTGRANLLTIVDAAIYGARRGDEVGKVKTTTIPGPSVVERTKLAVEIASVAEDFDAACWKLGAIIGCGLHIAEAVPVSIGLFIAARGDPNRAIIGAVNLGGDSDSVATIVGSICGAYAGFERVDLRLYQQVSEVNAIDLPSIANRIAPLARKRAP